MQLHQRGLELVMELLDAADHIDQLTRDEHQRLLREAADVMADLLKRDIPVSRGGTRTGASQFRNSV